MKRGQGAYLSIAGALFALTLTGLAQAQSQGENVGYSWAECVVEPHQDRDSNGLDDSCEWAIASHFAPMMIFGEEETASERRPYWAIRPAGHRTVQVFFATSYIRDAGDPVYFGATKHDGDSEFMVFRIQHLADKYWGLNEAYLSAHYLSSCDSGGWYPYTDFTYVLTPRGRPYVYIAEGKHGTYPSLDTCESGGCLNMDSCGASFTEPMGVTASGQLGLISQPVIDETTFGGNHEWYFTDVIFCGWLHAPGADRKTCVPDVNSYVRELTAFQMLYGPVGSSSLCQTCGQDSDCKNGGLCLQDSTGALFCGQECGGMNCPAGSECQTLSTGETQCVPENGRSCACFAQCQNHECGPDGCGGICGTCSEGQTCTAQGHCEGAGQPDAAPSPEASIDPGPDSTVGAEPDTGEPEQPEQDAADPGTSSPAGSSGGGGCALATRRSGAEAWALGLIIAALAMKARRGCGL